MSARTVATEIGTLQLRRCPFCGNPEPRLVRYAGKDGFRDRFAVLCDYDDGGCGAEGGQCHYRHEAVLCWNARKRKWENG